MLARLLLVVGLLLSGFAQGGSWSFSDPIPVTLPAQQGIFHHLESAGRRNIAVSSTTTAIVWEDNLEGDPRIRIALGRRGKGFGPTVTVSGDTAAYEPAVVALPDSRFLVAWEEAGKIWLRMIAEDRRGPRVWTGETGSRHVTLASGPDGRVYAAWSQPNGRYYRIVITEVKIQGLQPKVSPAVPADAQLPRQEQLYPSLAVVDNGLVVAWEDRREGHTRLYFTSLQSDGTFRQPTQLNEHVPPPNPELGRGTGVTRVALASNGKRVAATWMDKREFEGGYDIYAAISEDQGRSFGPNEKVQDPFGDNIPQWHPSVALGPDSQTVVAWDDPRDEAANVWLAWRHAEGWSDDFSVPGARGRNERTHPVIVFDAKGALHIAWVSRTPQGGTRIWYAVGRYQS